MTRSTRRRTVPDIRSGPTADYLRGVTGLQERQPTPVLNLDRCPHCGVSNPLLTALWADKPLPANANYQFRMWATFACSRCGGVTLAAGYPGSELFDPRYPADVWPAVQTAHEDLPERARKYLEQAYETLSAPDAAAVMAGSAVDAMLKALGYLDGSVYRRIDQALADSKITDGMARWAHAVRLGANRPRHADEDAPHVSPEEARQSVAFAEALGNFLFVITARIDRGIEAAESS